MKTKYYSALALLIALSFLAHKDAFATDTQSTRWMLYKPTAQNDSDVYGYVSDPLLRRVVVNQSTRQERALSTRVALLLEQYATPQDQDFANEVLNSSSYQRLIVTRHAKAGVPSAQYVLSELYYSDTYSSESRARENIKLGWYWLNEAYKSGHPEAGYSISFIHRNGLGTSKDMEKARYYVKSSADKNRPQAQYEYAVMLLTGAGGEKDQAQGLTYMQAAAENNHAQAKAFISKLSNG